MSDRAKARLIAAGLSLLLSAQVALILVGALVLIPRLRDLGPPGGGTGSVSLAAQPPGSIVTGTGGIAGPLVGGGATTPSGPTTGSGGPPPAEPCVDCEPATEPIVGLEVEATLPLLGSMELPLRVGTSSGDNRTLTLEPPRARLRVSLSRHPVHDLRCSTCETSVRSSSKLSPRLLARFQRHHSGKRTSGRPVIRGVGRLLHSLG